MIGIGVPAGVALPLGYLYFAALGRAMGGSSESHLSADDFAPMVFVMLFPVGLIWFGLMLRRKP